MSAEEPAEEQLFVQSGGEMMAENAYPFTYDPDVPSDEPVGGWLAFFLYVGIGIGLLVNLFAAFSQLSNPIVSSVSYLQTVAYTELIFVALTAVIGVMTIVGFYKRWRDAVYLGMTYIGLMMLYGLVMVIFDISDGYRSLIWGTIWFLFLMKSSKVERMIPPAYRQMTPRCWILGGIAFALLAYEAYQIYVVRALFI